MACTACASATTSHDQSLDSKTSTFQDYVFHIGKLFIAICTFSARNQVKPLQVLTDCGLIVSVRYLQQRRMVNIKAIPCSQINNFIPPDATVRWYPKEEQCLTNYPGYSNIT
ncbi:uncharacterized protein LOC135073490 [Ostrinia nubilalis]|uniref:uncharacterized protein LOC135073490 n=1 Tax=Ostrinia nubilalis TaxID=29057 RepID=UPI0030823624